MRSLFPCVFSFLLVLLTGSSLHAAPKLSVGHFYVLKQQSISPFSDITIETGFDGAVKMFCKDLMVRNVTDADRDTYFRYFSNGPIIEGNYYDDGLPRKDERIEFGWSRWYGRWQLDKTQQDRFHGSFLVFAGTNKEPFAHVIDGFIGTGYLGRIMNKLEEDFDDHNGLLGQFKATLQRLTRENARGYAMAVLDFSGDSIGFFIKDAKRFRQLSLLQDTYLHQLSYLGYNWGIEKLQGRTVAEASTIAQNTNKIRAYEAMGYYPFKSREPVPFGANGQMADVVELMKPVNPIQATYRFGWLDDTIALDVHLMSYYSTKKTFTLSILDERDGKPETIFAKTYNFRPTSPFSLLTALDGRYAGRLLWLRITDVDGIIEPVLLPLKVNMPDKPALDIDVEITGAPEEKSDV